MRCTLVPIRLARRRAWLDVASWVTVAVVASACGAAPAGSGVDTDLQSAPGTASGSIDGKTFDVVSASWLIGKPDDPVKTRVIFVFDNPISCADINAAGWDTRVTDATQALEMKLIGTTAGAYPIAANGRPAIGESDVNYTVSATTGTPSEVSATSGTVVVDTLIDGTSASGNFDLTFPGGSVAGTFDAGFCNSGREP